MEGKKVMKETREGWERLVWGYIHNAVNRDDYAIVGWGLVSRGLAIGSHHALEICRHFGADPHEYVQPGERIAFPVPTSSSTKGGEDD